MIEEEQEHKKLDISEVFHLNEIMDQIDSKEYSEKIQNYKEFLTARGSQVMVKNQGKRSLAYPIKGFETATSVQFVYLGNGDLIKALNVELQRDETVLRAITTKLMDESLSKLFT